MAVDLESIRARIARHPDALGLPRDCAGLRVLDIGPLWQFFPRDSLGGDATNKWTPNLAGLKCVLEECQFEVLEVATVSDRTAVKARSLADKRLEYYRKLDAGTRIWGRGGRPAD